MAYRAACMYICAIASENNRNIGEEYNEMAVHCRNPIIAPSTIRVYM